MTKKIIILFAFIAVFGIGGWLMHKYYQSLEIKVEEQAQVLLERVESVAKLITLEGYFSEIYDYKDYYGYDLSLFRKKALLRVKAKVSVGYDLSEMKISSFPNEKKIVISNIPDPKILSIDHEVDYYDLQQGVFNPFTTEDYTKLNANAKDFIRKQAESSDLFIQAETQSNKMLEMIKYIVESANWELEYKTKFEAEKLIN